MDKADIALLAWIHASGECDPRTCRDCLKKKQDRIKVEARRLVDSQGKHLDAYSTSGWYDPNGTKA